MLHVLYNHVFLINRHFYPISLKLPRSNAILYFKSNQLRNLMNSKFYFSLFTFIMVQLSIDLLNRHLTSHVGVTNVFTTAGLLTFVAASNSCLLLVSDCSRVLAGFQYKTPFICYTVVCLFTTNYNTLMIELVYTVYINDRTDLTLINTWLINN